MFKIQKIYLHEMDLYIKTNVCVEQKYPNNMLYVFISIVLYINNRCGV